MDAAFLEIVMTTPQTNKPPFLTNARLARWGRNTACLLSFDWVFPHPELPAGEVVSVPVAAKAKK